jgi:hypothetical protein
MKAFIMLQALLLFASAQAQVVRGKSNVIPFKGSAVVAEEQKVEEDRIKKEREEQQRHQDRERVTLETLGITRDEIPNYYALIMGVSEYKYASPDLPNLQNPLKDAEEVRKVLLSRYTFTEDKIIFLANPTRSELINSLDSLAEITTPKDNVLVFYAGHGYWDKFKEFGYWLPSDASIRDKSTWIPNSTLKDYLGAIKSKHTLLIADACFSGSIFKSRSVDPAEEMAKFMRHYREKSRRAMTSGYLGLVPDKSIFIDQLMKKLRENEDWYVTGKTLFTRIYEPVSHNADHEPQYGVILGVGDEGGDFVFIRKD